MRFRIYRYNPETDREPYMQEYDLPEIGADMVVREALIIIKGVDETLSFRHSCGEGVCGSDAMNINGRSALACLTKLADLAEPVEIRPVAGLPVIRDLVVDMTGFYRQYRAVKPYLINRDPEPEIEHLQSIEDREKLDGLYECIMCGCCSTMCPSFTDERLDDLEGPYKLYRCHTIMNCVEVCPKGLNPTKAIGHIKQLMLKKAI
jgi:succinate dehydrogenase / fumarate reductase iron-sulfur subunit